MLCQCHSGTIDGKFSRPSPTPFLSQLACKKTTQSTPSLPFLLYPINPTSASGLCPHHSGYKMMRHCKRQQCSFLNRGIRRIFGMFGPSQAVISKGGASPHYGRSGIYVNISCICKYINIFPLYICWFSARDRANELIPGSIFKKFHRPTPRLCTEEHATIHFTLKPTCYFHTHSPIRPFHKFDENMYICTDSLANSPKN